MTSSAVSRTLGGTRPPPGVPTRDGSSAPQDQTAVSARGPF